MKVKHDYVVQLSTGMHYQYVRAYTDKKVCQILPESASFTSLNWDRLNNIFVPGDLTNVDCWLTELTKCVVAVHGESTSLIPNFTIDKTLGEFHSSNFSLKNSLLSLSRSSNWRNFTIVTTVLDIYLQNSLLYNTV